jgi:hypothetical protein
MRYTLCSVGSLLAIVLALAASAAPALAADQVPFTIDEQINAVTGATTFTATGPLCPSGTFADTVQSATFNASQLTGNVLIRTVYTCADGSGTFTMLKHVFLQFNPDFSSTNTGPVQILGGTGAYTDLLGHGEDNGESDGQTSASGEITGWVLTS